MKLKSIKFISKLLIVLSIAFLNSTVSAQKPINGNGKAYLKTSLNAYSFTKPLLNYAKGRANGPQMTLFEFMDFAAEQGFEAVDLTGYFFPGYPEVPSDDFIYKVKRYAFQKGLDISGTGVRNDFADPDPVKRKADVKHVKEWIDVAAKLGAPVIRVFSGPVPEGYKDKWDEVAEYMAVSLKECAEYGKQRGVLVGVQNHGDFLSTADQTIKIVEMVNSDWFGVIVDVGYFITPDPYADIEKVMPYAVNFQLKESVFGAKSTIKTDLLKIMDIIIRAGYRGYIPIETLSATGGNKDKNDELVGDEKRSAYDPYTAVPAFLKEVKAAQKLAFNL
ncbi:MAG: sugar phosphate isomerase/epimerase [Bacteroidales bacterium]|nr:sugar phosphate isomerase/epimerase [Bacteroidales bacterium]MCF8390130.1 sugar phosphate isomerase/epimerase [Bacteroidales bacterium]